MRYSKLFLTVALGVAALAPAASALAAPLFDVTAESGIYDPTALTLGYKFTVINEITVDGIGVFDEDSDGLRLVHNVALWKSTDPATAIVSGSVGPLSDPGNSDWSESELGSFLYETIVPEVLAPGDYVLAATYGNGNSNKDGVVNTPGEIINKFPDDVAYGGGVFGFLSGSGIAFPTIMGGDWFGPALRHAYDPPVATAGAVIVSIPEPLTLALLAIGMAGVGFNRRRHA